LPYFFSRMMFTSGFAFLLVLFFLICCAQGTQRRSSESVNAEEQAVDDASTASQTAQADPEPHDGQRNHLGQIHGESNHTRTNHTRAHHTRSGKGHHSSRNHHDPNQASSNPTDTQNQHDSNSAMAEEFEETFSDDGSFSSEPNSHRENPHSGSGDHGRWHRENSTNSSHFGRVKHRKSRANHTNSSHFGNGNGHRSNHSRSGRVQHNPDSDSQGSAGSDAAVADEVDFAFSEDEIMEESFYESDEFSDDFDGTFSESDAAVSDDGSFSDGQPRKKGRGRNGANHTNSSGVGKGNRRKWNRSNSTNSSRVGRGHKGKWDANSTNSSHFGKGKGKGKGRGQHQDEVHALDLPSGGASDSNNAGSDAAVSDEFEETFFDETYYDYEDAAVADEFEDTFYDEEAYNYEDAAMTDEFEERYDYEDSMATDGLENNDAAAFVTDDDEAEVVIVRKKNPNYARAYTYQSNYYAEKVFGFFLVVFVVILSVWTCFAVLPLTRARREESA
jgi:hypothetical protein